MCLGWCLLRFRVDKNFVFADPVPVDTVPDYLDVVKHPMCLSNMLEKVKGHQYDSIESVKVR